MANSGERQWSELELFDLRRALRRGDTIEEVAAFLKRENDEVRHKAREMGLILFVAGTSERHAPQ
jgi:hypothetical protein